MTTEEKEKWAQELKIGDLVCDCRCKHLKIVGLGGQGSDNSYDVQLILEDESCCSAMNCCDSVDHSWEHPDV